MTEPSRRGLLAASGVAFTGVVSELRASTVSGVLPDERTVVVDVEQVVKAPPAVGLGPGARVTVRLSPELPAPSLGDRAAFFATGWVYADTIAGRGGRPAPGRGGRRAGHGGRRSPGTVAAPRSLAETTLDVLAQTEVLEHARAAEAVVRGRVVSLAEVPTSEPPREHDPDLWTAVLAVDLVEKGDVPGVVRGVGTVSVSYANSQDVRWREALKPKANQAGLWLLHRPEPGWVAVAPFTVLHGIDLQPSLQLDFLRERGL